MSDDLTSRPQLAHGILHAAQMHSERDEPKDFVDSTPVGDSAVIIDAFHDAEDVDAFVEQWFDPPAVEDVDAPGADTMWDYIEAAWGSLTKTFDDPAPGSTLLPLPRPHVVAGGRFREAYYWDSYFTAEGLAAVDRIDAIEDMARNFAHLVESHGRIPNGSRSYYLSRSQPPLFYRIVRILHREADYDAVRPFVDALNEEHAFWMRGVAEIDSETGANNRVVSLPDGMLNRYWDDRPRPRPESYPLDWRLAAGRDAEERPELYRDIRAACESGWDFSSRWLRDPTDLASIHTTDLVPVDLNAFLFEFEKTLAGWYRVGGEESRAVGFWERARDRRAAIEQYCWSDDLGLYVDYDWTCGETTDRPTLATVVPLFTGLASEERADRVAERLREDFLCPGGLRTSLVESGQQWDAPHGWPPLQYMAVAGLHQYGHHDLAEGISDRWLGMLRDVFDEHGVMFERYDVEAAAPSDRGGEYDVQTGFGWTNGVALALDAGRARK